MKFLPLRDFDEVTSALNFDTPDCHVIGGCDIYTTKAAGSDKKLYRNIENSLESQYESLLRLSASVSPPHDSGHSPLNLSRSSPFGPLSQVSSRRTFAYLIATLNASHPDYDFSHDLRPADFRKERSLKAVINTIDSTLYSMRPSSGMTLQVPSQVSYTTTSSASPANQTWGPHMWSTIDNPFDGEEGSTIWSLNYFFFNKDRKRVAYIYVRGVPVMTQSPRLGAMAKRGAVGYGNDSGANKRARYWLGDRAANITNGEPEFKDDIEMWEDDEIDPEYYSDAVFDEDYDDEADDESDEQIYKGPVRGVSEDIAASMDMDF
jgi:hypothetical protein